MSGAILGYQPLEKPSEWPLVADGVRMVAAATCDSVPYPVPKVMLALSGLAMYAERVGIARDPLAWLAPEVMTRYLLARTKLEGSSVQTYRSILLRIREALLWLEYGQQPTPRMSAKRQRAAPYTPPELARYLMWARTLPLPPPSAAAPWPCWPSAPAADWHAARYWPPAAPTSPCCRRRQWSSQYRAAIGWWSAERCGRRPSPRGRVPQVTDTCSSPAPSRRPEERCVQLGRADIEGCIGASRTEAGPAAQHLDR